MVDTLAGASGWSEPGPLHAQSNPARDPLYLTSLPGTSHLPASGEFQPLRAEWARFRAAIRFHRGEFAQDLDTV